MLGDENHPGWRPLLHHNRVWTADLYLMASVPCLVMLAQLVKRFVRAFLLWPWPLGWLAGRAVPVAKKTTTCAALHSSNACDLDSIAAWFKGLFPDVPAMLSEPAIQLAERIFREVPVNNVPSENRFALNSRHADSSHGNPAEPATIGSNHVLAESKTYLDAHMKNEYDRRPALPASSPPPGVCTNAWQAYVQKHRSEATMAELAGQWALMSPEQKQDYQPADPVPGAARPRVQPEDLPKPWPYVSDDYYPVSEQSLLDIPEKAAKMDRQWKQRIGDAIANPRVKVKVEKKHLCGTIWGPGRCCLDMSEECKNTLTRYKLRVRKWFKIAQHAPAKFDGPFKPFGLFFIGKDGAAAAAAAEDTRGHLLLLLHDDGKVHSHEILVQFCPTPSAGEIVRFTNLTVDAAMDHNDVARMWQAAAARFGDSTVAYKLEYEYAGLMAFRIARIICADVAEAALASRKDEEKARKQLLGITKESIPRRRRVKRGNATGGAKKGDVTDGAKKGMPVAGGSGGDASGGSDDSGDASSSGGTASSEDGVSEGSAFLDEANNAIFDDARVSSISRTMLLFCRRPREANRIDNES